MHFYVAEMVPFSEDSSKTVTAQTQNYSLQVFQTGGWENVLHALETP